MSELMREYQCPLCGRIDFGRDMVCLECPAEMRPTGVGLAVGADEVMETDDADVIRALRLVEEGR